MRCLPPQRERERGTSREEEREGEREGDPEPSRVGDVRSSAPRHTLLLLLLLLLAGFLLSSAISLAGLGWLGANFEETLPVESRRPLDLGDMQPLSFLQLMSRSATLRSLMMVTGLQTMSEGRNINTMVSGYMQNDLKWDWTQINRRVARPASSSSSSPPLLSSRLLPPHAHPRADVSLRATRAGSLPLLASRSSSGVSL